MPSFRRLLPLLPPLLVALLLACAAPGSRAAAAQAGVPPGVQSLAAIRQAAEQYVRDHLPPTGARQARIDVQGPAAGLRFPRCDALQARAFGNPNPVGAQTIEVVCTAPRSWSVYLPVQVSMAQGVVLAARPLQAGYQLTAADLTFVQRDLAGLPPGAVTAPEQAIGQVLQYSVGAGQSITEGMLAGPQLIHYGQAVSLVAQGPGLRMVALGVAMENGRQGQHIMARNAQSGKVVSGVVDASGEVVVAVGQ